MSVCAGRRDYEELTPEERAGVLEALQAGVLDTAVLRWQLKDIETRRGEAHRELQALQQRMRACVL